MFRSKELVKGILRICQFRGGNALCYLCAHGVFCFHAVLQNCACSAVIEDYAMIMLRFWMRGREFNNSYKVRIK